MWRRRTFIRASANCKVPQFHLGSEPKRIKAATAMTGRSGRLQKRSENGQKSKVKQSNRKQIEPLAKLQCEENQMVLEGITKPGIVMETTEKDQDEDPSTDSSVWSSLQLHFGLGCLEDVWEKMVNKEQNHRHSKTFLQNHPNLDPGMRSVLLDWLIEVSDAFTLQRQTFYLAQDYFDRFMLTQKNVEKGVLQLIGITCLFIASKMEEAHPPKVSEMTYVTAGTYYEEEILQMELIILKTLQWNLCSETALSWLSFYFQMASVNVSSDLLKPQFPQKTYVLMTRLLDLCTLNINSLDFQYRVLAASVLCHFIQQETVEKLSGLCKDVLQPCVSWMAPFVETVGRCGKVTLRDFTKIKTEERHNIQTHTDYITMLDAADQMVNSQFLTPPNTKENICSFSNVLL